MLSQQVYLGHTVNFKTHTKSYKNKKTIENDPSEWVIFENTHEAIIDRETFDIVQRIRSGRRRFSHMGEMPILSGMVFCADCGKKLYQVRGRNLPQKPYMVCSTYRKVKGGCSGHQVQNETIEKILLDGIRGVTSYVREHEDEFVEMVNKKSKTELERSIRSEKHELEQAKARINKLDVIVQRLYEDNVEGKISDDRFATMSANYESEQSGLKKRITEIESRISLENDNYLNTEGFIARVKKYTDIKELNAEIIREFVEKIIVHSKEQVDGRKIQRIRIVWNFIGEFNPPEKDDKEKSA